MDNHQRYVEFVAARHLAYSRRLENIFDLPGTSPEHGWAPEDHIVNTRKFTNVFRLLDRGTQFVQDHLLWCNHEPDRVEFDDAVFRAYLYRFTNTPEPWIAFRQVEGRYPIRMDLETGDLRRFWTEYANQGNPIFGNAYRMFVGQENKGKTRLQWVIDQAELLPKVIDFATFERASTSERNEMLQAMPRTKNFMSMQILADLEDSPWVRGDGNGFIIPGPGALVGAAALGVEKGDTVRLIHRLRLVWAEDGSITLPTTTRTPNLMDVQNTLCEFGKYVRWSADSRSASRKPYVGKHPVSDPFIPPHLRK